MSVDYTAGICYGIRIEDDDYESLINSLLKEDMINLGMPLREIEEYFGTDEWFDVKFEFLVEKGYLFDCDAYNSNIWILGIRLAEADLYAPHPIKLNDIKLNDEDKRTIDYIVNVAYNSQVKAEMMLYDRIW